jgi:hypothetical protein
MVVIEPVGAHFEGCDDVIDRSLQDSLQNSLKK